MCYMLYLGFTTLLTSQVISIAFYIEREKSNKYCLEALILTWDSFTCRKSTTRELRLYFPSEGSHTQDVYALKNPSNPRTSDPEANMITTGPPWSTAVMSRSQYSSYLTVLTIHLELGTIACSVYILH